MKLTPEQSERVRLLVEDEWDDWREFDSILAQMSAEELHEFADKMNWDGGGADRLMRVLKHPKCDRGTALMIYWLANPIFDLKYGSRENVKAKTWPARVEEWDMMRYIEQRLQDPNGFATARIPYDPTNDRGRDLTKQRRKRPPKPLFENRGGEIVKVGEEPRPDDPEIDVRASLPSVVFQPVGGDRPET
jgi:hypothetical protein